jgi:histidyl-tRNA synthetase
MADKKPQKLKARLPRGLADRGPGEIAATRRMIETISQQYELYGFEPVETPAIEYTDALGKFLPDQDRPNEGVFSFQDDDEQWLSLRYDLTAPLARYVAENFQNLPLPYRSYRYGWVFRNEKPGPGRYRQFMQFDADTVGSASPAADAEMCMLAADTMEALGIPRGQYIVKINNRKVLDGVLEALKLGGDENAGKRLTILRAIDKYDRLGAEGVKQLLGPGRKDESGDFTKGAGLNDAEAANVLRLMNGGLMLGVELPPSDNDPDDDNILSHDVGGKTKRYRVRNADILGPLQTGALPQNDVTRQGVAELMAIEQICSAAGYGSRRIRIDTSVVRGLEYYTGPVYEVELTIPTQDEKGRPVRFGSVGGGGRYDGLVSRFRGEPVPATGFSIGVSRLMAALSLINKSDAQPDYGPVVVTVFGAENVASSQQLVQTLRAAGIRSELYLGNPKHGIGQQLKYADKRRSPCAVIQGPDEKKDNKVLVRDLILGAAATDTTDRDAYLKKQAEAQTAVDESKMVEEVRKLLARHSIKH